MGNSPLLNEPRTEVELEWTHSRGVYVAGAHMQGWRKDQEDSGVIALGNQGLPADLNLFGVFDGHGGKAVSLWVANNFLRIFKGIMIEVGVPLGDDFSDMTIEEQDSKLTQVLIRTFHRLDREMILRKGRIQVGIIDSRAQKEKEENDNLPLVHVYTQAEMNEKFKLDEPSKRTEEVAILESLPEKRESYAPINTNPAARRYAQPESCGCTAVVSLVVMGKQPRIITANLGDSRAALVGVTGKQTTLKYLTFDHKPEDRREIERIHEAGGTIQNGRVDGGLNLTRALGDHDFKKNFEKSYDRQKISSLPDVGITLLSEDCHFIILGCDGLWELEDNKHSLRAGKALGSEVAKAFENLDVSTATDSAILDALKQGAHEMVLNSMCPFPMQQATQGLGLDNLSATVVFVKSVAKFGKDSVSLPDPRYVFGQPEPVASAKDGEPVFGDVKLNTLLK